MNTNYSENNQIKLVGKVSSDKKFSHEIYGEKFYIINLSIPRLSNSFDSIPVTISERLLPEEGLAIDCKVSLNGQFRSYNSYEGERSRLILTVFAKEISILENQEEEIPIGKDLVTNEVKLDGYICKKPIYRKTPFGREISDILLAVNRSYSKSDYIPCIVWGRTARFTETIPVGSEILVVGRVQSREYEKKIDEFTTEKRVAYEVSVSSLEVIEKFVKEDEEKILSEDDNQEAI